MFEFDGEVIVEIYMVVYNCDEFDFGFVIGCQVSDGVRFFVMVVLEEIDILQVFFEVGMDVCGQVLIVDEISMFVVSQLVGLVVLIKFVIC